MKRLSGIILVTALIFSVPTCALAQKKSKKDKEEKKTEIKITDKTVVPHTIVQNQSQSGTCWCFAGTGFVEAEILRKYNVELNLSEMYFVRWAYAQKFSKYVRMHGTIGLSPGGEVFDVLYALENDGMIPDASYTGLVLGSDKHQHGELHNTISEYAKVVTKKSNGEITSVWPKLVQSILDTYLGEVPAKFNYEGAEYTPKTFAKKYALNIDDYVQIASFTHRDLYKPFNMEIPDNWTNTLSYNMTLDELMGELDNALENGYTVGWAQDVSDKLFSRETGLGTTEEKEITDEMHQKAYDTWQTTDDHSMLIVGIAYDQNGEKYYKVKNSWGTDSVYEGYWYCSESYVRLRTVFFTINKEALTKEIKTKLNIN